MIGHGRPRNGQILADCYWPGTSRQWRARNLKGAREDYLLNPKGTSSRAPSEGPCGEPCRIEGERNHKVPPAYSRADDHPNTRTPRVPGTPEEDARSLNGRRDDDLSQMRRFVSAH